jgi:hypothetical protein
MDRFKAVFGLQNYGLVEWRELLWRLVREGGWPLLLGIPLAFRQLRRYGWLSFSIALSIGVWLLSVSYTNGGLSYSMRVLSPALVLASVLVAVNLHELSHANRQRTRLAVAVVSASTLYGAFCGAIFPTDLTELRHVSAWEAITTPYVNVFGNTRLLTQMPTVFPENARILADDAYAHSMVANNGGHYTLVPIWSPEVKFLFDARLSPGEQRKMLLERGITGAIYDFQDISVQFIFETCAFFKYDSANWLVVHEGGGTRQFAKFERP